MLAILGWLVLVVVCLYFIILGGALAFAGKLFNEGITSIIGVIVLACALTGMYNVCKVSPFSLTVDTHVYQEHK